MMNRISKKPSISYDSALNRAATLCAGSEHCPHEIREKLLKWGVSETDAARIVDYLVNENYINEERFCRAYALDKMRYNKWGRMKIDQGLSLLRLDANFRRQALAELPEDEYLAVLTRLLEGKARTVKAKSAYDRNNKLLRFALSHGFEMSLILECLPEEPDEDAE